MLSSNGKGLIAGKTPTLYLVRHGDTAYNSGHTSPERFRSHIDVPLSEQGHKEAEDLAKKLSKYPISCVYSSDLQRASDTAEAIADACKCDHETDDRLRPWDLGKLAGTPVKEGIKTLDEYSKTPDKPLPGGESLNDFKEDYLDALDDIMDEAEENNEQYAVVTHSRDLQMTKASAAAAGGFSNHNIDLKAFNDYADEVHTGDILKVQYSKGQWKIIGQEKG